MRIILDTDKKTITVPWNYQDKLNGINEIIIQVSKDETKKKSKTKSESIKKVKERPVCKQFITYEEQFKFDKGVKK